jgi:hypothetical protein
MTTLITTIANDRSREMRREAAARRRLGRSRKLRSSRREADHHVVEAVAVRRLAVAHLAELDSTEPLNGDVLGAELDGRLVAAISLTTGETIADPFTHTDQVRSLLEARAEQLRGGASRFGLRRRSAPVASTC